MLDLLFRILMLAIFACGILWTVFTAIIFFKYKSSPEYEVSRSVSILIQTHQGNGDFLFKIYRLFPLAIRCLMVAGMLILAVEMFSK
jgi:hypothetical protein